MQSGIVDSRRRILLCYLDMFTQVVYYNCDSATTVTGVWSGPFNILWDFQSLDGRIE
jgi:hypothetical protein